MGYLNKLRPGQQVDVHTFNKLVDAANIKMRSAVGCAIEESMGAVSFTPTHEVPPIWGRITKEGPSSSPDYYEWERVEPNNEGKWKAVEDVLPGGYGSQTDAGKLLNPAVEINGGSAQIGSVVRLIPTRLITNEQGHSHRAWLFSSPKAGGLRPFRLYWDLIPTGGNEPDTWVAGEWLDEPGHYAHLYPEHRSGWPSGDEFISLGIGRCPGAYFRGTYGWAKWVAHGTQTGYDEEGTAIWRGEWQIVTLYADLIAQVLIYEKAIEPGDVGTARLLWIDKHHLEPKMVESGYSIQLFNNKQVRLEVGTTLDVYFSRLHYIWTPLSVPYQPHFAKIGTAWTNTSHGSDANESVIANECDYAGRNIGKEVTLTTLMKPSHDTAMFPGDVVQYDLLPDGTRIITSDVWDLPIGRVVWESVDTANIRRGWFLCDGNNGTPDLSGRFIMCIDDHGLGAADEDDIGDTGGFRDHGGTENDHDNHSGTDVAGAIADHTKANVVQALANHDDHATHYHLIGAISGAGAYGVDFEIRNSFTNIEIDTPQTHSQHAVSGGGDLAHAAKAGDNDLKHSLTKNNPRYYVMAAIKRVE